MAVSSDELESVLKATAPDLLAYFERRLPNREDAADLLGEVLLQAWRRVEALPASDEHRRMWLFTIATNVLANHRRTVGRHRALTEKIRTVLCVVADEPEIGESAAVRDAVRRLPPHLREMIMLVHWDGFTLVNTAELLGINASTARSRYSAARSALQSSLTQPSRC